MEKRRARSVSSVGACRRAKAGTVLSPQYRVLCTPSRATEVPLTGPHCCGRSRAPPRRAVVRATTRDRRSPEMQGDLRSDPTAGSGDPRRTAPPYAAFLKSGRPIMR